MEDGGLLEGRRQGGRKASTPCVVRLARKVADLSRQPVTGKAAVVPRIEAATSFTANCPHREGRNETILFAMLQDTWLRGRERQGGFVAATAARNATDGGLRVRRGRKFQIVDLEAVGGWRVSSPDLTCNKEKGWKVAD